MDARRLIDSRKYEEACENLWREIREKTGNMADNISGKRILVIGTEEHHLTTVISLFCIRTAFISVS